MLDAILYISPDWFVSWILDLLKLADIPVALHGIYIRIIYKIRFVLANVGYNNG